MPSTVSNADWARIAGGVCSGKLDHHIRCQGINAKPVRDSMYGECRMHRMGGGDCEWFLCLRTIFNVCHAKYWGSTSCPHSGWHDDGNAADLAGMRFKYDKRGVLRVVFGPIGVGVGDDRSIRYPTLTCAAVVASRRRGSARLCIEL